MKEKILIKQLFITKQGEIQSFQIRLPDDLDKITAVLPLLRGREYIGQFFISDPPLYDLLRARFNMHAGRIMLQSAMESGIFFAQDIILFDNNQMQGDFSQAFHFRTAPWSHGYQREGQPVEINDSTPVVFGTYTDRYNQLWAQDIPYTINIYLWYTTK